MQFASPQALWLLGLPAALLVLWLWRIVKYRGDVRQFRKRRQLPIRERAPLVGGLLFWLFAILATACTILAVARPNSRVSLLRSATIMQAPSNFWLMARGAKRNFIFWK